MKNSKVNEVLNDGSFATRRRELASVTSSENWLLNVVLEIGSKIAGEGTSDEYLGIP